MNNLIRIAALSALLLAPLSAATLKVGPLELYKTPCAAFTAAKPGDVIEVPSLVAAPVTFAGKDAVCRITTPDLTFRGVGGRVILRARDARNFAINVFTHGIWSLEPTGINPTMLVENVDFVGAAVPAPDSNGAGIKQITGNLTCNSCGFYYNQNGILSSKTAGKLILNQSHFAFNGAGEGQTHNIYYAGPELVFSRGISRNSNGGQAIKSRAVKTTIEYSLLGESLPASGGNSNFEMSTPNGGEVRVIGNVILQSSGTTNGHILTTGEEGYAHTVNTMTALHNTIVGGRSINYFFRVADGPIGPTEVRNNIFVGAPHATPIWEGTNPTVDAGNYIQKLLATALFVGPADYRLQPGSPIATAAVPGVVDTQVPFQPLIPYAVQPRTSWKEAGAFALDSSAPIAVPGTGVANPGVAVGFEKIAVGGTQPPPPPPPPTDPPTDPPPPSTGSQVASVVINMVDGTSIKLTSGFTLSIAK